MKVYLAGGFYANNWQDEVTDYFLNKNIIFFNPKIKERNENNDVINKLFSNPKNYTTWDLRAIDESDVVFAYIDRGNPAIGVTAEIGYAVGKGIPVVFVLDDEIEGESYHKHRYFDFLKNMPLVNDFNKISDGCLFLSSLLELKG